MKSNPALTLLVSSGSLSRGFQCLVSLRTFRSIFSAGRVSHSVKWLHGTSKRRNCNCVTFFAFPSTLYYKNDIDKFIWHDKISKISQAWLHCHLEGHMFSFFIIYHFVLCYTAPITLYPGALPHNLTHTWFAGKPQFNISPFFKILNFPSYLNNLHSSNIK